MLTGAEITAVIQELLAKYHAESALLFGSYARGEETPSSDVDLIVFGGRRFISEKWVDAALRNRYCFEWNGSRSLFYKGGMYGQMLLVIPGLKTVFAVQSYGVDSSALIDFTKQYYKI